MNPPVCPPVSDTSDLRHQLVETCLAMSKLGYFIGTWGNISVRVKGGLLVTPTKMDYGVMTGEDLVVVDWEGERIRGERLPTSEVHLHRLVLQTRPDLGVLIHSHAPWCSAVACARQSIPALVEDMAQIIGGEVRCSKYAPGGHHMELAQAAVDAMGDHSCAALLANHGVIVGARDLGEALVAAQVLEKAAMLYVNSHALGGTHSIPPQLVQEERERYLYKYGTTKDAE